MLKVDTQEPEIIINYTKELCPECEVTKLDVGDFHYQDEKKNIIFERKTYMDLVGSFISGHLQKQLLQMQEGWDDCYLLISGNFELMEYRPEEEKKKHSWTVEHHTGMLASLAVRYPKIKMVTFSNDKQLVKTMLKIINKTNDGKIITIRDTELLKNKITEEDINIRILTGIPKIGIKTAEKLLKNPEILGNLDKLKESIHSLKPLKTTRTEE